MGVRSSLPIPEYAALDPTGLTDSNRPTHPQTVQHLPAWRKNRNAGIGPQVHLHQVAGPGPPHPLYRFFGEMDYTPLRRRAPSTSPVSARKTKALSTRDGSSTLRPPANPRRLPENRHQKQPPPGQLFHRNPTHRKHHPNPEPITTAYTAIIPEQRRLPTSYHPKPNKPTGGSRLNA